MTFRDALAASPALFPLALDSDIVQFVQLSESDYARASFLDARMLKPGTRSSASPWAQVEAAAASLPLQCDFLFHISHCGSTLLSRLLGTHPQVFSLREPQILRTASDEQLPVLLRLWSRTFHPRQRVLLKATSFVGERAESLLAVMAQSRALLMHVPARTFLRALLDGAMSDVVSQAPSRHARLQRRLDRAIPVPQSPGESVSLSWLCEMLSLSAAAQAFPDRTLWLEFDEFLQTPVCGLIRTFSLLGIAVEESFLVDLLASPLMTRYAKKLEVSYDAKFREKLLRQADEKYSHEIQSGLDWLREQAERHEIVRKLLTETADGGRVQ